MIPFVVGHLYRRRDIHAQYKGQHQGGISTPAQFPIIFLFSGEQGGQYGYHDGDQSDGTYWYTGHGQVGDMRFVGGNLAIRDHAKNGKELHLFEYVGRKFVQYRGKAQCIGFHHELGVDRNKNPRQTIVFELVVDPEPVGVAEILPETITPKFPQLRKASLEQLRHDAYDTSYLDRPPAERKVMAYYRSEVVKAYVLRRAAGVCEGCLQDAPFTSVRGNPYLEPHHLRRRADGGPDHPAAVIALCPNCHARVHFGRDGREFNQHLSTRVEEIEQAMEARRTLTSAA